MTKLTGENRELEDLVPIKVIRPNGEEQSFAPKYLRQQVAELREKVITSLYGEPIPDISKTLLSVSIAVLDKQEKQQLDEWDQYNYGQWAHFTRILPDGGWIQVTLLREYTNKWEDGDFARPPTDSRFSTTISIERIGRSIQKDEYLTIELENIDDDTSTITNPLTNIMPIDGKIDPQVTFYNKAQSFIGIEDNAMLRQSTPAEPLNEAVQTMTNSIIFGTESAPMMLYPSIGEIPFIGLSRSLRTCDSDLVSLAIDMITNDPVDVSVNQYWGRNALALARTYGYASNDEEDNSSKE